eukprot:16452366-Heterocapsa_arctica.AAC.1
MEADCTMGNAKIVDAPVQTTKPTIVETTQEASVENMPRVVMHNELPPGRTCVKKNSGREHTKKEQIKEACAKATCITCSAKDNSSTLKSVVIDTSKSTIIEKWIEMKGSEQFKNWDAARKVDELCGFMAGVTTQERKLLGSMGAVRLSRKQAISYIHSAGSLEYIHTLMTECNVDGQEGCIGYILYEDLGKKVYGAALTNITQNDTVRWMNPSSKGGLVECILALGILYQKKKCDALEGIMDRVILLEDQLRMKPTEELLEQAETGDTLISNAEFRAAIDTLNDKIDKMAEANSKKLKEHLDETIRTKMIMEELLREATEKEAVKPKEDKLEDNLAQRAMELQRQQEEASREEENRKNARLAEEEKQKQDTENAAQATEEEQQRIMEDQMKEKNILDIKAHRSSESAAPWLTDLSDQHLGNIATWARKLHFKSPDHSIFGYRVLDDMILTTGEMDHSFMEKQAHVQCHDALSDGHQGKEKDKKEPGYKFDMISNSRYGWVPHSMIYGWL